MCYSLIPDHIVIGGNGDDDNNKNNNNMTDQLIIYGLISGFSAAICMTCLIFLIIRYKKHKIEEAEKFKTMYHRVNDTIEDEDDPEKLRVINKGL